MTNIVYKATSSIGDATAHIRVDESVASVTDLAGLIEAAEREFDESYGDMDIVADIVCTTYACDTDDNPEIRMCLCTVIQQGNKAEQWRSKMTLTPDDIAGGQYVIDARIHAWMLDSRTAHDDAERIIR